MRLTSWIIDYVHLFRGRAVMYLYRRPPRHYLGYTVKGRAPIVLVPGIAHKWGFLKKIGDNLSRRGHPVYIVPKLRYNLLNIPTSAKTVREVAEENKLKDAIIVSHSKGGLIGKYLLIYLNKDNFFKGMIAIAAPFSGSKIVKFIPHATYKELLPTSKIVLDLQEYKGVNSKIISIFPESDYHIWSESKSYLEGAKNIKLTVKGHHSIVFSKELSDKILEQVDQLTK